MIDREMIEEEDFEPLEDDHLLEEMVRAIVARPDSVEIVDKSTESGTKQLHVLVHPEDRGKVIGKNGRMADILRQFMSAVGARSKMRIHVMVEAGPERPHRRRQVRSADGTAPRPSH